MGDFNSEGKWDTQLPSILPLPTEDEIFDDEYCTAQVMDMRYHIDGLEAEVERLEGFINDLLDPKTNWPLERIQAHLDRIDEWQEGKQE